MSGHWICESCGSEWQHSDYCKYLRPADEQWKGSRSQKEMDDLRKQKADAKSE